MEVCFAALISKWYPDSKRQTSQRNAQSRIFTLKRLLMTFVIPEDLCSEEPQKSRTLCKCIYSTAAREAHGRGGCKTALKIPMKRGENTRREPKAFEGQPKSRRFICFS